MARKLSPAKPTPVTREIDEQSTHRDRILHAASDSFLEFGFERTSTADIARRARISKRELYSQFADKRALLAAVVIDLQSNMQSTMDLDWTSTEDVVLVLHHAAGALLDFILSERFGKLLRIVAAESYLSPEIAEQFYSLGPHNGTRATAAYLKSQMKQGKLRTANPLAAAEDFLDLVVGAQLMTAIILGQVKPSISRRAHVKHAVASFLKIYGVE